MGSVLDAVEVVLTSSTATAVVNSVFGWLKQRRLSSKVSLRFRTVKGTDVTLKCGSSDNAAELLATVREIIAEEG